MKDQLRVLKVLKWLLSRKKERWPKWIDSKPGSAPPARVDRGLRITFVNHSTFLIQVDGMNILTDPIWSDRAGPLSFIGAKRIRAPGLDFDELPFVDLVLVSHNHYDHMDMPTLKRLEEKFSPLVVTGSRNKNFLEKHGLSRVEELEWWEGASLPNRKKLFFVPAEHFSGRSPWNINKSLWGGFVIESSLGHIYFAGDTGFGKFFEQIHGRFPDIRLALLPIGAYEPRWFMGPIHLNPEDAVQAHKILKPKHSVGIHFGTFQLSDEGINAPFQQLEAALKEHGVEPEEFIVLDTGETAIES
jgi:L-ascorbate metabolism protein UlaG (beta-lactamase superfamily)